MANQLCILASAEADIEEVVHWYEDQESGIGLEFLRYVGICLKHIERNPHLYPVVYKTFRRALLRRFPFAVYYEIQDDIVLIFAVLHCAQHQNRWRARLQ